MQRLQAARNDYGRFVSAFQTLKIETIRAGACACPQPDIPIEAEPRRFLDHRGFAQKPARTWSRAGFGSREESASEQKAKSRF
jgi:hypothetical protein